jgi:hypothetical protein
MTLFFHAQRLRRLYLLYNFNFLATEAHLPAEASARAGIFTENFSVLFPACAKPMLCFGEGRCVSVAKVISLFDSQIEMTL